MNIALWRIHPLDAVIISVMLLWIQLGKPISVMAGKSMRGTNDRRVRVTLEKGWPTRQRLSLYWSVDRSSERSTCSGGRPTASGSGGKWVDVDQVKSSVSWLWKRRGSAAADGVINCVDRQSTEIDWSIGTVNWPRRERLVMWFCRPVETFSSTLVNSFKVTGNYNFIFLLPLRPSYKVTSVHGLQLCGTAFCPNSRAQTFATNSLK